MLPVILFLNASVPASPASTQIGALAETIAYYQEATAPVTLLSKVSLLLPEAYHIPPKNIFASLKAVPVIGSISSRYGYRSDPIHDRRTLHKGMDFRGAVGEDVFAAGGGRIAYAGWRGGYGKTIVVDHGFGLTTRYAHLSKILVKKGDNVSSYDHIGDVGSTGRSTGPHLHFEVRIRGKAVDPIKAYQLAWRGLTP